IIFHTTSVDVGDSGGALLNRWGEIVGVVFSFEQLRAHAVRMDIALDQLCARTLDTSATRERSGRSMYKCSFVDPGLTPPAFPRAGYTSTVDAALLGTSRGKGLPSGRIIAQRQMNASSSWHAGVMRLAPPNISLVAVVAGASLDVRRGRWTASP